jgi:hypothetical protein
MRKSMSEEEKARRLVAACRLINEYAAIRDLVRIAGGKGGKFVHRKDYRPEIDGPALGPLEPLQAA